VRTLVTGASGFLGHAVCADLLTRGHEVTALVRRAGSAPAGTTPAPGDLLDPGALNVALDQARPEAVLHLAAEIATQRDASRIEQVNVGGTRLLLDACRAHGEPRVVFVSTVVTGDAHGELLDEGSILPVHTAYGRSKQRGEELIRESGLSSVIIRPSHVYGAGGWYASEIVGRLRQPGRLRSSARGGTCVLARLATGADPVRAVVRSARSSYARIKQELGWRPQFPTAREGVPDAVAGLEG